MSVMDAAIAAAKSNPARVILPETGDQRIRQACVKLKTEGLAVPVKLAGASDDMAAAILAVRPMKDAVVWRLLEKPLYRAAAMVATGAADAMVAGVTTPTRRVIEAASICIGLAPGAQIPSSCFLMLMPDGRELIFADCALNVSPDAGALAQIAIASARSATTLFGQARLAMLSFSTGTSGSGAAVDLVRDAVAIAERTGLDVTGPLQGDAALNATVAAAKGLGSGDANTLIFPDLNSGNIAYKLLQELYGAQAVGPILQGFRRPVCDLSRGATVADIVAATTLTLAMV